MADFGDVINAYVEGRKVNMRPLALFDFRDAPAAFWGGEYPLTSGGRTWIGLGAIAAIDGLDQAATLDSSMMTFTLSGVEKATSGQSLIDMVKSVDRAQYVNRLATVFLQFFDEDWQPLNDPYAIKAGIMTNMPVSRSRTKDGFLRTISLTANNIFYGRGVAPASRYTDRDQQKRHPGDLGLQFIPTLQNKQIPVPWR